MARERIPATAALRDTASLLGFAAAPTFALMAWISLSDVHAMICSSASTILPINGMALMYLLMSLFHLSPWLRLFVGRGRPITDPQLTTTGDRP